MNELEPEAPLDGQHIMARVSTVIRGMKWLRITNSSDLLTKSDGPAGGTATMIGNFAGLSLELRAICPNAGDFTLVNKNNGDKILLGRGEAAWSELRRKLGEINDLCELAYSSLAQIDLAYAAVLGERVAFKLDTVDRPKPPEISAVQAGRAHDDFMKAVSAARLSDFHRAGATGAPDNTRLAASGYAAAMRDGYEGRDTPTHRMIRNGR